MESQPSEFTCKTCGVPKPLTPENFGPCPGRKSGFLPDCRLCKAQYVRDWKRENRTRLTERRRKLYAQSKIGKVATRLPPATEEQKPLRRYAQRMVSSAGARAREKNVPISITTRDVWDLIEDQPPCSICDAPLQYGGNGYAGPQSPSLDRIIPSKGYVRGNIGILCHLCNSVKNSMTPHQIMRLHAYICEGL